MADHFRKISRGKGTQEVDRSSVEVAGGGDNTFGVKMVPCCKGTKDRAKGGDVNEVFKLPDVLEISKDIIV